ncbi:MAG: nucleotidyltransferase domain-containing protein [Methylococcales bacterium]
MAKTSKMNREAEIKSMIADVMHRNTSKLKDHKVFLFGSRATGKAKQRSDFDIGVLGEDPLPLSVFFTIEDQLEALPTLYKIDWMDFNKVSDRFRKRAMQQIEVLYE